MSYFEKKWNSLSKWNVKKGEELDYAHKGKNIPPGGDKREKRGGCK